MCFKHCRNDAYNLNFDLMELDDSSKYDGVRRLTNFDSLNFPSKWKIYWWNNFAWEEYNQVSFCFLILFSTFYCLHCPLVSLCVELVHIAA